MNKNILIGIGGVVLAGIGYIIWKNLDKKEKEADADLQETIKRVNNEFNEETEFEDSKDIKDDNDFLDKLMEEQAELEKDTKNWDDRNEKIKKELYEKKKSLNDQDMFEDKVVESKEFASINTIREAAGKGPIKVSEGFEKFLGKDSESKSMKESLDNIAENIKKDPKLKKQVLDILSE